MPIYLLLVFQQLRFDDSGLGSYDPICLDPPVSVKIESLGCISIGRPEEDEQHGLPSPYLAGSLRG